MAQGGNDIICEDDNGTTVTIRTKPCWICGQHSYLHIPYDNWIQYDVHDVAIDVAWPRGSADDRLILRTGVHPKCWDEEFPDNFTKEN